MPQPIFKKFDIAVRKDIFAGFNGKPLCVYLEISKSGTYDGHNFVLVCNKGLRRKSEMMALELLPTANYNVVQVMKDFGFSDRAVFQWHDFKTLRIWEEKCP